jgi:hypothetical protein
VKQQQKKQLKTFSISFEDALKAVGEGESLIGTLYMLQDDGVIDSFEMTVSIKVDRDKATIIEQYFLLQGDK